MKPLASLGVAALLAVLAGTPTRASFDIEFDAAVRIHDDIDLYFAISSRYFDRDRESVTRIGARYRDPDDLAVALFLCKHSGESPQRIYRLRRSGLAWWDIAVRIGVPVDVWFVEVRRDPGPPYGKAYGHWKRHRRNPTVTFVLADVDVRNLVAVRMAHEYYGVPVEQAMRWRSSGRGLAELMAVEYRDRHYPRGDASKSPGGPGKGKGKGNGKGRGKQH